MHHLNNRLQVEHQCLTRILASPQSVCVMLMVSVCAKQNLLLFECLNRDSIVQGTLKALKKDLADFDWGWRSCLIQSSNRQKVNSMVMVVYTRVVFLQSKLLLCWKYLVGTTCRLGVEYKCQTVGSKSSPPELPPPLPPTPPKSDYSEHANLAR